MLTIKIKAWSIFLFLAVLIISGSWTINIDSEIEDVKFEKESFSLADSLRNAGNSFYNTNPDKCIQLLDSAATLYKLANNKKQQVYCIQNIAFTYSEKKDDYLRSISYIMKAISIWKELKSIKGEANLLKYLGMLQGKLRYFDEAKTSINNAIRLFNLAEYKAGVAVSYYDLALVYENEGLIDSCLF